MKIGIIGAGEVAAAIAAHALKAGHNVALSSRSGPESETLQTAVKALGANASATTVEDAASRPLVILALPWAAVEGVLVSLPHWGERILVDATNPYLSGGPTPQMADLGGKGASEVVADLAPGARVVKAFNSMLVTNLALGPHHLQARRILFVSGDDAAAKGEVTALIESFGFAVVDLGGLVDGGRMQQAGRGPLAARDFLVLKS